MWYWGFLWVGVGRPGWRCYPPGERTWFLPAAAQEGMGAKPQSTHLTRLKPSHPNLWLGCEGARQQELKEARSRRLQPACGGHLKAGGVSSSPVEGDLTPQQKRSQAPSKKFPRATALSCWVCFLPWLTSVPFLKVLLEPGFGMFCLWCWR